jgi:hypothetical protein
LSPVTQAIESTSHFALSSGNKNPPQAPRAGSLRELFDDYVETRHVGEIIGGISMTSDK